MFSLPSFRELTLVINKAFQQSNEMPNPCSLRNIITACKRSLGQGTIFTPVCQSFCSQGGVMMSLTVMDSTTPSLDSTTRPVNKRAVRILLEYFLVQKRFSSHFRSQFYLDFHQIMRIYVTASTN